MIDDSDKNLSGINVDKEDLKKKADELRREVNNTKDPSPDLLIRLATYEYDIGDRETSARILLKAMIINPNNDYPRRLYNSRFTPDELRSWELTAAPTPIMEDLNNIFMYPLSHNKWATMAVFAGAIWVLDLIPAPIGPVLSLLLILSHFSIHLNWSASGRIGDPGPVEWGFSYMGLLCVSIASSYSPALGSFFFNLHPFITVLLFITGALIFPMAFLASSLFNESMTAFNYKLIFCSIGRIFKEYLLSQVILVAVGVAYFFFQLYVDFWWLFLAMNFVSLYFITLAAHITGRLYYVNQLKLNWFN